MKSYWFLQTFLMLLEKGYYSPDVHDDEGPVQKLVMMQNLTDR